MKPTAYFSAEIGFSSSVPTYSGGLGVLAGDHLKATADSGLPIVGVTLLYREGYFRQHLDGDGQQTASYPRFIPEPLLERLQEVVTVTLAGRDIAVKLWRYDLVGHSGDHVPIIFLDAGSGQNAEEDRAITLRLYGGGQELRLRQEALLALAGVKAIRKLYPDITHFHLNEGHCAFVPLVLMNEGADAEQVRSSCHFTTHTPVPAGHDAFTYSMAKEQIPDLLPDNIRELAGEEILSMSELALSLSRSANGVSRLHGEIARDMFPHREIGHVTNGVHHLTWVSPQMQELYDDHLPGWRVNPEILRTAPTALPTHAVLAAHQARKTELLSYVNAQTQRGYGDEILTIGFARRAATYKRADLVFRDLDRLKRICGRRVQFVFAGKAHPKDEPGQALIARVVAAGKALGDDVRVAYIPNYNMWSGALITSGVDIWLNTPMRPREASGTSGMKATINGVPNASISDGWWAEGAKDGENGWVIGSPEAPSDEADIESLYQTLRNEIIPAFYDKKESWAQLMKQAIATGAQFTAARMVDDYKANYYR